MNIKKRKLIVLIIFMVLFTIVGYGIAANNVVVIPLNKSKNNGSYASGENPYTWNDSSGGFMSLSIQAECPNNCIAVNGACSEKTVGDASRITITGSNFSKTDSGLPYFNAYTCWMLAQNNNSDPPIGYAQVICYCN